MNLIGTGWLGTDLVAPRRWRQAWLWPSSQASSARRTQPSRYEPHADGQQASAMPRQGAVRRIAEGTAADRGVDRRPARDALRQRPADRAGQGLDRHARPSDAARRLQRHREGPLSPLQSLRQRADVLHASPDLVGRGDARRASCRASRRRTAASACRPSSSRGCGRSASSACASSSRATTPCPTSSIIAKLFNPSLKPVGAAVLGRAGRRLALDDRRQCADGVRSPGRAGPGDRDRRQSEQASTGRRVDRSRLPQASRPMSRPPAAVDSASAGRCD